MSRFFWLPLAGVLAVASCAPVAPPAGDPRPEPDPAGPAGAERLEILPTPASGRALPPSPLAARIEAAVGNVRSRDLLTTNGFWTVFHGILGLGPDVTLLDPAGRRVNAVDYV